jgi:hypothetical protein
VKLSTNSLCEADFKRLQEENEKLKQSIKSLVEPICNKPLVSDRDDFEVFDYSGCNVNDAFELGIDYGEKLLAMKIMKQLEGGK